MKRMNDGWHKVYDYEVYVENGIVKHGIKKDISGWVGAVYPYRWDECYKCWIKENVSISTLRNGLKKGNWKLS